MKRAGTLIIAVFLFSALGAAWYHWGLGPAPSPENEARSSPQYTLKQYLTAVYSRDYDAAYPWVSAADREVKSREQYLRENPSFYGPALRLVRSLAHRMEINDVRSADQGDKTTLRFNLKLPDANDPSLQKIFLAFDLDHINRLSAEETRAIELQLKTLVNNNKLPMLEGEEQWELVKEADGWRVFLNWAGATRVLFEAKVMEGLPWKFEPVQDEVSAKPGETLQAVYRAKNLSDKPITAKARHIDEPKELASKYLEIIQCFCFIQQTLAPGEEREFPLVFRVNWNVPAEVKEFRVSYEFYPIHKFPGN
jgi:hypothetical protein